MLYAAFRVRIQVNLPEEKSADNSHQQTTRLLTTHTQPHVIRYADSYQAAESLLFARVSLSTTVSDLGVLIDSQLIMSNYVATHCRACFFQLRQLHQVRSSLTKEGVD